MKHGNLEPEERLLPEEDNKKKEDTPKIPKLDGYACPYPRRKLSILNE